MPFQLVILDAAVSDADAAKVWAMLQAERLNGMKMFADGLAAAGHLRADVTVTEARDVLWTYNSAELYRLLVIDLPPKVYFPRSGTRRCRRPWSRQSSGTDGGQQLAPVSHA